MRATYKVPVELAFHFEHGPAPDSLPVAVEVQTKRFPVKLADHGIAPRDDNGRLVSSDLALLGRSVGKTAKIDVRLIADLFVPAKRSNRPAAKTEDAKQ